MLADLVRNCVSTDQLPALFTHLGYEPDSGMVGDGWRAVARWRTFRVVGADADDSARAARAMARRLGATAQPGLVAAVGRGTLVLAVPRLGTPGSSPLLAIATDRPDRLHLQLLAELAPKRGSTALAHALRAGEVLASEGAGDRFFEAFRALVHQASAAASRAVPPADRALLALLPLTRILFLYFVQAKGWLDHRPDYLRAALDEALRARRRFHRAVLHPLFFGTLNRPPAERATKAFGHIPYLNGGLFELHPVERAHGPLLLPNPFWRDAFDHVFERFRFCLREGEQVDAIAPDMLGRTFERIMQDDERKVSGTFYTPERLVRDVVTATLATALEGPALDRDAALALLGGRAPGREARHTALRQLAALRVLDPAAGSGAFLLGALDVLSDAWSALGGGRGAGGRATLRRHIVRRQLFGVDLNPVAVRLAELRLWLALIADDPETDIARIAPLPNLNGVVRQGDTLFDPLAAARALGIRTATAGIARIETGRRAVFAARGASRARAITILRDAELLAARDLVAAALSQTGAALRDLLSVARGRDLFGGRAGLSPAGRATQRALRAQIRALRAAARRIAHGTVPFFSFDVHHPAAAAAGGFDAVIGNPPWVRAERLPAALRTTLASRFRWWRAERCRGFAHRPDLAVAFLERAVELAKPGGAVGLLLPSKVTSAGYAETARHALVRESTITYVHRVPADTARRFRAAVYPLVLVLRKAPAPPDHRVALGLDGRHTSPQRSLAARGPWILAGDRGRAALASLKDHGQPLAVVAPPMLGVKTGADPILVGTVLDMDDRVCTVRLGEERVPLEAWLLRPALRGRDLGPFRAESACVLFWPYAPAGGLHRSLPPLAARWIAGQRGLLERRSDFRGGPCWTLFRTASAFAEHAVVWPDLARQPSAAVLDAAARNAIPLNTCYVSAAPDSPTAHAVAATLNSTWIRMLVHFGADEARGGYRRHNARVMGAIPVPHPGPDRDPLVALSRDAHATHDVSQQDLDRAVAEALGLPAATRADLAALANDLG